MLTNDIWQLIFNCLPTTSLPRVGRTCRRFHGLVSINNWNFWKARALRGRQLQSPFDELATRTEAYLRTQLQPDYNWQLQTIWSNYQFQVRSFWKSEISSIPGMVGRLLSSLMENDKLDLPRRPTPPKSIVFYLYLRLLFREVEFLSGTLFNLTLLHQLAIERDDLELLQELFHYSDKQNNIESLLDTCNDHLAKRCFLWLLEHKMPEDAKIHIKIISVQFLLSFSSEEQKLISRLKREFLPLHLLQVAKSYTRNGISVIKKLDRLEQTRLASLCADLAELEYYFPDSTWYPGILFYSARYPQLDVCNQEMFWQEKCVTCPKCSQNIETREKLWWHSLTHLFIGLHLPIKLICSTYCCGTDQFYSTNDSAEHYHDLLEIGAKCQGPSNRDCTDSPELSEEYWSD